MKILILGGGGREHAIAWKIKQSSKNTELFISPGNAGTQQLGTNYPLDPDDNNAIVAFIQSMKIEFVIIGSETYLANGIGDELDAHNIKYFGCSKQAAQLESSKIFMKELCQNNNIPTASFNIFSQFESAYDYITSLADNQRLVIKTDGLAAGKGVLITNNKEGSIKAITDIFQNRKFGSAGDSVIIEEFLEGKEISIFILSDGETVKFLTSAGDYKKALDNDLGANTGGMGSYSPSRLLNDELLTQIMEEIIHPTFAALKEMGIIFKGVLYAGLMVNKNKASLLEYNIRFGDPETQSILLRLESDLLDLLYSCSDCSLDQQEIIFNQNSALNIVITTKGYPDSYKKLLPLPSLKPLKQHPQTTVFHAGTILKNGELLSNGGRVLNIAIQGSNIQECHDIGYNSLSHFDWEEGFYRTDIGKNTL